MKVRTSIPNLSLRRKILVSIALVSLIPLIVLIYYFYGYYISLGAALCVLIIMLLGWRVIFEVFTSVSKIYVHSKDTLKDMGERPPEIPDEVQSLEHVINLLSNKVKDGFEQLKDFTQKTEELNREVTKKVLILSVILQANDLFSKEAPEEEVINFLSTHLKDLLETKLCFCGFRNEATSELKIISCLGIDEEKMRGFLDKHNSDLPHLLKIVIVDKYNKPKNYLEWADDLALKNIAIAPVISKGHVVGLVGVGNNSEDYSFKSDDLDVLSLFSQNVTLVWEHKRLSAKIEELEILDYLTGLYNEKMIRGRLEEEIRRSIVYQRPCGFITLNLANYTAYQQEFGLIEAEKSLKKIAKAFKRALRPIDIAGRIGPSTLGAILIESNKRQCQDIIENIKRDLEKISEDKIRLAFSIAESPINGATAQELIAFVQAHVES
jgi:diguanylate cyclase (GGDEF)-like protein